MRLDLVIPSYNLRVARRRHARIARASSRASGTGRALLLWRVLIRGMELGRRGRARGAVVHGALRPGSLGMGGLVRLVALGVRLAVAAVMHEDVDTAVLWVGWNALVPILIRWFGVLGDDVPRMEEARYLGEFGVSSVGHTWRKS